MARNRPCALVQFKKTSLRLCTILLKSLIGNISYYRVAWGVLDIKGKMGKGVLYE